MSSCCLHFLNAFGNMRRRAHRGRPFVYQPKALIVFFVVMQQRRTFRFKAQHRWLQHHPDLRQHIGRFCRKFSFTPL